MKAAGILLAALSVLLGATLWTAAIWTVLDHQLFLLHGVEGVADVVALEENVSRSGSRDAGTVYYTPVLRFMAKSGQAVEFRSGWSSNPPEYDVGEQVEIVYSEANPKDARAARLGWTSAVPAAFGSLFIFLGGRVFYARRRNKRLLRTGIPIRTTFFRLDSNPAISVNGKNPWVIVTQWQDPATRAKRFFHSDNLWSAPTSQLSGTTILVYVDPESPSHYAVDLSFLAGASAGSSTTTDSKAAALTVNEEARVLSGRSGAPGDEANDAPKVSSFVLDGNHLGLQLVGPPAAASATPKDVLQEERGQQIFVHFDPRKASGLAPTNHPTHAVLSIEAGFEQVKLSADRLTCVLEGGARCAVPWDAIFAIVVTSTNRGLVWLRQAPADACIANRSNDGPAPDGDDATHTTEIAPAQHLAPLTVNDERVENGHVELLIDGESFPGIAAVRWSSVLGFFMKLRLSGATRPLRNYLKARARFEKRPVFLVELAYETKIGLGRAVFGGCTWQDQDEDTADTLTLRPSRHELATRSKASGWGHTRTHQ